MPWVRLDDEFYDHPKFAEAGPLGLALWVSALAWSNRNLKDGFVPTAVAKRLVDFDGVAWKCWMGEHFGGGEDPTGLEVAEHLVACKLFEETPGGYRIHDYHDYQPHSDEILAKRAKERERWQRRQGKPAGDSSTDSSAVDSTLDSAVEESAVCDVPKPKGSSKDMSTYTSDFEAVWALYPRKEGKKAAFSAYKRLARREDPAVVALAVENYATKMKAAGTEVRFIKLGSTFFGPEDHYLDHVQAPRQRAVGDVVYDDTPTEYR